MNNFPNKSERGQAIVYLVLGIVVFFGFVALAIDGGMALADRRNTQNAADASSLAGGGSAAYTMQDAAPACYAQWTCDYNAIAQAEVTAMQRARDNNFSIFKKVDSPHYNFVDAQCHYIDYPGYRDKFIDVTVEISSTTKSNFAQLVFPGALQNQVDAVTRVHPPQPIGFGNAIVALNPGNCSGQTNGITISGNGGTLVEGGGIFSNGCLRGNGTFTVTVEGTMTPAPIPVGHQVVPGDLNNWTPDPQTTDIFMNTTDLGVPTPNCSDPAAYNWTANQLVAAGTIQPGLYCVSGNVSFQGSHNILHGDKVTIVLLDGAFTTNGNADIQLSSLGATSPAIDGVTIYLPETNSNTVIINGNSSSYYKGLVYAPKSLIKMDGTGQTMYVDSQVIGWNVTVGGTANTTVIYDGCTGAKRNAYIELSK